MQNSHIHYRGTPQVVISVSSSTDNSVSGESALASNSFFHSGLEFSKAVRAPYAAMSSYSIIMITGPVSGPGTVLRNRRNDLGMTLLENFGAAASCSLAIKSAILPGLT